MVLVTGLQWKLLALVVVFFLCGSTALRADPVASHLNALAAELSVRSAALEGTTDKAEKKQKKAVDKLLKAFARPSTSLAKDLKLAGKMIKTLQKSFPAEFSPGAPNLGVLLGSKTVVLEDLALNALIGYAVDVQSILNQAQGYVDSAVPGKCRDKAQKILDKVDGNLASAGAAPDYKTLVKALGKAAKDVVKGMSLAEAALECDLPNNLPWYISVIGLSVDGDPRSYLSNDMMSGTDSIYADYLVATDDVIVVLSTANMLHGMLLAIDRGSNPNGPDFITGNFTDASGSYEIVSGGATVRTIPNLPDHITGTFEFTAEGVFGTVGTIQITGGTFSVHAFPF